MFIHLSKYCANPQDKSADNYQLITKLIARQIKIWNEYIHLNIFLAIVVSNDLCVH